MLACFIDWFLAYPNMEAEKSSICSWKAQDSGEPIIGSVWVLRLENQESLRYKFQFKFESKGKRQMS